MTGNISTIRRVRSFCPSQLKRVAQSGFSEVSIGRRDSITSEANTEASTHTSLSSCDDELERKPIHFSDDKTIGDIIRQFEASYNVGVSPDIKKQVEGPFTSITPNEDMLMGWKILAREVIYPLRKQIDELNEINNTWVNSSQTWRELYYSEKKQTMKNSFSVELSERKNKELSCLLEHCIEDNQYLVDVLEGNGKLPHNLESHTETLNLNTQDDFPKKASQFYMIGQSARSAPDLTLPNSTVIFPRDAVKNKEMTDDDLSEDEEIKDKDIDFSNPEEAKKAYEKLQRNYTKVCGELSASHKKSNYQAIQIRAERELFQGKETHRNAGINSMYL